MVMIALVAIYYSIENPLLAKQTCFEAGALVMAHYSSRSTVYFLEANWGGENTTFAGEWRQ